MRAIEALRHVNLFGEPLLPAEFSVQCNCEHAHPDPLHRQGLKGCGAVWRMRFEMEPGHTMIESDPPDIPAAGNLKRISVRAVVLMTPARPLAICRIVLVSAKRSRISGNDSQDG